MYVCQLRALFGSMLREVYIQCFMTVQLVMCLIQANIKVIWLLSPCTVNQSLP